MILKLNNTLVHSILCIENEFNIGDLNTSQSYNRNSKSEFVNDLKIYIYKDPKKIMTGGLVAFFFLFFFSRNKYEFGNDLIFSF